MAGQLAGKSHGRGKRRGYRAMAEINMTPFIDVMLVLLIVFMVAAPMLTVGVPVDLPKTNAAPLEQQKDPLFVTVQTDGRVFVQETPVELTNMVPLLIAVTNNNPEARILVRGDAKIAYGKMLEVMGTMSAAGFKKVGLVAEMPNGATATSTRVGAPKPAH
ncbi:biopolymer transporter ExbD [Azospirillum humicireducens]|uniref:Biopolymer transporter ExbD n=1 Tax=Azospirillum humicireducens TaxID=1226968 RepID=A0A168Y229_9PROT|nr:biopolymer transporter ExbD [Azospirillum humicireducens]ANC91027.1 biopolymer transporter ExbD [Azospirillum humicireducens]